MNEVHPLQHRLLICPALNGSLACVYDQKAARFLGSDSRAWVGLDADGCAYGRTGVSFLEEVRSVEQRIVIENRFVVASHRTFLRIE